MSDVSKILDELAPLFEEEPGEAPLRGNAEARVAARLLYVDGLLHEAFASKAARRPRGVLRWIGAGLAAAVVLAALLVWLAGARPGDGEIARVEQADRATAAGRALAAGDPIHPGSEVRATGSAAFAFADGTRLDFGADTRATLVSARRVSIARGTVEARVAPRGKEEAFVLATPHGEALVLGTTLRLAVGSSSTLLEVREGKVRLTRSDRSAVEVTSGHYAVAAAGVELSARRISRGAEVAARMAPNTWASIPGTALRPVTPSKKEYPKIHASNGPAALFTRSGGGALDTRRNRLMVWGGGFIHYHGNEIYAFDLEALAWERLTDPCPAPSLNQEMNPDGTPVSRDVFGGFAYIAHADRLFACGGWLAGGDPARPARCTWTYDPSTRRWRNMEPSGALPPTGAYNLAVYDPVTKKVWWGDGNYGGLGQGLYTYDFDANVWAKHASVSLSRYAAALDTRRRQLVFAGRGQVFSFDLASPAPRRTAWTTAGGEEFLRHDYVGFDYDPAADRFVGWAGGPVFVLDPERKAWTAHDAPGAPPPAVRAIQGRWRYVPAFGVFVAAWGLDENVYLYKPPG